MNILKKKIKKVIVGSVAMSICLASVVTTSLGNVKAFNSNEIFEVENSLYDEYKQLNNSMNISKTRNFSRNTSKSTEGIMAYTSSKIEGVVVSENYNSIAQISKSNGNYIYAEARMNDNSILLELDNYKYLFTMEGENIYMTNEFGEKTTVSEMIYEDTPEYIIGDNITEVVEVGSPIQTRAWSKEYGPFYKTNKSLVSVLSVISFATGLFSCVHPVLGKISLVLSGASIGIDVLKTMYIKFYQSLDGTRTKERQRWYENSDYTKFKKERIITFDNVRPGY